MRRAPLARILLPLALAGCASTSMPRTGFLDDYSELAPAPERTVRFVPDAIDLYVNPELGLRRYGSILIDPVVYRPIEGAEDDLPVEDAEKLARYYGRKLRDTLARDFEIVDAPRGDTARVRAALTEIDSSNVYVNIVATILLIPVDMGGVGGELEVVDAETGERLVAMTACRDGTPLLSIECFNHRGHARHGMKKWARELRDILGQVAAKDAPETPVGP